MERDVTGMLAASATQEIPAVDLSPDGGEPYYQLTSNGYYGLLRAQAALQFFAKGKHNPYLSDMSAAFLADIDQALAEITLSGTIAPCGGSRKRLEQLPSTHPSSHCGGGLT